ncbi:MAG: hypothetical protein COV69_01790 [Parcubacteria group bacterium CG11_big_fil_rev_8_21_14_0_20_39_14]|nr:MAG: hypothetical protein COV69_01790 [Parcubacteria group bacterium CG11_big_fil_rev_8_21_14_0_20_39_14]PIS34983.1 MAG: hypothetical protein COT36_04720 [Parcubacteria group bacterium CG08_land_8_20_14_0_20_38_56]
MRDPNNKTKIVFDFDHTLFSTRRFYNTFKKAFEKLGVDEKLFQETFKKSKEKGRYYKPSKQIKLITKKNPKTSSKKLKESSEKALSRARKFLYPDALPLLRKSKRKYNFYILSCGKEKFQRQKIKISGISKYFKKILITQDDYKTSALKKILKNKERILFIDDQPLVLFKIKKTFPEVITIRINRGEGGHVKERDNSKIDFSIKNFKQLEKILKRNFKN